MPKGPEVKTDEDGNLVTTPGDPPPVENPPATEDPDLAAIFQKAGAMIIAKRLSVPSDLRTEIFRDLGQVMNRLHTVMGAVDIAEVDRGEGGSTLTPILGTELGEVAKVLQTLAKRLSGVKKSDDLPADSEFEATLEALSEILEGRVEKRGAKMGGARLSRLKELLSGLVKIVGELDGDVEAAAHPKKKPQTKSAVEDVTKAFGGLTDKIEKMAATIQKQNRELRDLREARPASNTIPVEQGHKPIEKAETTWPMDMAPRQRVDKGINFSDNQ